MVEDFAGTGKNKKKRDALRKAACTMIVLGGMTGVTMTNASAGQTFDLGNGHSMTLGAGIRAGVGSVSPNAPGGYESGTVGKFSLDDFRIYTQYTWNQYLKATVNTERGYGNGPIGILDAYAQFEPRKEVNVWIGQMLPPSDRSNLDGPFYLSQWYYPFVSQYPSRFNGRDVGATVWGKVLDNKLVYSVGIFAGHNLGSYRGYPQPGDDPTTFGYYGPSNQGRNPLFAGRVVYNFWDPEPVDAYYTASTYYGKADILSIGFAGMFQQDGVGSAINPGNYGAWNVDGLMEKKLGDYGVITLEGAYYRYDTSGVIDVAANYNNAGLTANIGGLTQGNAYLLSAAYLIPQKIGWGQFQPYARYQHFDATLLHTWNDQIDAGVNYVIKPHDLVLTVNYSENSSNYTNNGRRVTFGVQYQF